MFSIEGAMGDAATSAVPPFSALRRETARALMPLRAAIGAAMRRPESAAVRDLLAQEVSPDPDADVLARRLVAAVREQRSRASGVDALMHEFSLSSDEGVALMCLAEALLRIPDKATADRLIADKISKGDWGRHLGESPSLFVNAATWGLLITGKLVATNSEASLGHALGKLIGKGGEPLIRKGVDLAMRMLGRQFVTGQTIAEALRNSRDNEARGYRYSYDMLGEGALTDADAGRYLAAYMNAIHAIGQASEGRGVVAGPGISVKLSALHPRYSRAQRARVLDELLPRLRQLMLLAKQYDIGLNIDAEEADRLELSLDLFEHLAFDPALDGFQGMGFVVQAYQKRCPFVIDFLVDLARRSGRRMMIRLVKGAYWDSEIKRAQVDGMPDYPVYTRKLHTDVSYLVCARKLLDAHQHVYPQFATHNAHSVSVIHTWARKDGIDDYEFQCLHGMGESLYDQVVGPEHLNTPCRIYAPVGSHDTLLAYLVRRLLENGANSSFVNRIVDPDVSIDALVADPFATTRESGGKPHPAIALPGALFGEERRNSAGIDLNDETTLASLAAAWSAPHAYRATPATSIELGPSQPVCNPAQQEDVVGSVAQASKADVDAALRGAAVSASGWQTTPPAERRAMLLRVADLYERDAFELMGLAIREAGKSLPNAVAEVREAVDFLRYYATRDDAGRQVLALGPVACISPWNFPLAIFTGQVAAALAVGNVVLAKPAEQTPLIAFRAVQLFHEAGVPRGVLQFLPGAGEVVGAALCADARVKGVIFTGSTAVARAINQTLAQRVRLEGYDIPFIAETGGQNAMIVDSSALPEQVVQDVLVSAFDSAGQRCSALRVLFLQEEIAPKIIAMLKGAMQELKVGVPDCLATDIGPVIDAEARDRLAAHIEKMRGQAKDVFSLELPAALTEQGCFVAPTLLEISSLSQLEHEVFGPVLHVIRYRRAELTNIVDAINASGFGLTLGIHSRIDETIEAIAARAQVGNIYVNRNIVGAVVGVQPFGGEGKSGTGPKAGGPLYLKRLQRGAAWDLPPSEQTPPELDALLDWARTQGHQRLYQLAEQYKRGSLLGTRIPLPGPTGESNVLGFAPRGHVLCAASTTGVLLHQLAAVLASGNTAMVLARSNANVPEGLPRQVKQRIRVVDSIEACPPFQIALADSNLAKTLRPTLADIDGPMISLIETTEESMIPLWRLVTERALCINTSAAGGNASLMTLGL